MATIQENLETIGQSVLRDGKWAKKQLAVLHKQDGWLSGETTAIDPSDIGGGDIVKLKAFLADDSSANGRRYTHKTGIEPVTDSGSDWNQVRGDTVAGNITAELKARIGNHRFDWQVVMFLIAGLGTDGGRDVIDMLKARELVVRDSQDPTFFRLQQT